MGTNVLVDFETFIQDILPAPPEDVPVTQAITRTQLIEARAAFFAVFDGTLDGRNKAKKLEEDTVAEAVVKVINELSLPNGYTAALSRYNTEEYDSTSSKVDAALYADGHLPSDEQPNWTHCRLFIEFEGGEIKCDPWDDTPDASSEPDDETSAGVRAKLIAYAHNAFLHQHCTALYSLLFGGNEFRAVRWDRSGVIVSRKVDYIASSDKLVQFLWRFAQLNDTLQGLDPTATMLTEDSAAYNLMDELALPHPGVDVEYMDFRYPEQDPPAAEGLTAGDSAAAAESQSPSAADDTTEPTSAPAANGAETSCASVNPGSSRVGRPSRAAALRQLDPDLRVVPEELPGDKRIFKYVREKFRASLVPGWPRYKLRVGEGNRVFLVGKPFFESSSMFGRATRGYVAVDARTRRFVFLKDSWRPRYEGVEPEGRYLGMFANEPHMIVPALLCHGDVDGQRPFAAVYEEKLRKKNQDEERRIARTQARAETARTNPSAGRSSNRKRAREEADVGGRAATTDGAPAALVVEDEALLMRHEETTLRHHRHYRIAVKDVCLPFDCFRSTYQLIEMMFECIKTHEQACTKYGLLHRDISAGNVMILPRHAKNAEGKEVVIWYGVLTDWELAKHVSKDSEHKARKPERTGTWPFMSIASVASGWTLPIVVADELESFFHVVLFYAARYLPHNITNVKDFVMDYFDGFKNDADGQHCGIAKETAMRLGTLHYGGKTVEFRKRTMVLGNPLNSLIQELLDLISARYQAMEYKEKLRRIADSQAQSASASIAKAPTQSWDFMTTYAPLVQHVTRKPAPVSRADAVSHGVLAATAALLDTHDEVLGLFFNTLSISDENQWADTGVMGKDQLGSYAPRANLLVQHAYDMADFETRGSRNTNKRAKTG